MSSKLVPSNPEAVMVIRKVTPEITTFSVPFLRFGRIKLGGRGTVVRMRSGALAVFSPVALTDDARKTVAAMGEVKYITALDQEHHIFLDDWHKAYPAAKLIAPGTLGPKREKTGKPLPFAHLFTPKAANTVDADFDAEFDYEYVDAHANKEIVLVHKPSRTMIQADFIFNLPATEQMSKTGESATGGLLTRIFCAINNTKGSAIWQKRFIWYAISSGDRKGYNASVARIDSFDFDRMIPCHGDVIETNAKGVFRNVMEWHLAAAKKAQ